MKSKYPISKKDKQQQIENLLAVYSFIGQANKKDLQQTSIKKGAQHEKTE